MSVDPRVQKFYDEAMAAKKELRRLAVEIAAHRIDMADMPTFPTNRIPMTSTVIAEVTWALEHGRTDLVARIIEQVDQYDNSMSTALMMQARVDSEQQERRFRESMGEGAGPEYLDEESDGEPIRLSGEEAAALFSTFREDDKR